MITLIFSVCLADVVRGQADQAARDANNFGFRLLAESRKARPKENIFQSPLGLSLVLAMVESGAKGATKEEMARVLHVPGAGAGDWNAANRLLVQQLSALDSRIQLEIANGIWVKQGMRIKPDYLSAVRGFYQAGVTNVDFTASSTVDDINAWVSGKTHGKITEMVRAPLEPKLRLILLDAVYFKGDWASPFWKAATSEQPFSLLPDGPPVQRPMMSQTGGFQYSENGDFQAVALPYSGGQVSMYVFLPKAGLDKFQEQLTLENWEKWMGQFTFQQGRIELPRFGLDASYDLLAELKSMGMARAFTDQADFGGISDEPLLISWVKQKTHVGVDEAGTEAAAVSGVGIRAGGVPRPVAPSFTMIVNRPFYVAIREDQSGAILFHGAIFDPK